MCFFIDTFFKGSLAVTNSWYNEYNKITFLTGLNCSGTEDHILNCPVDINSPVCPNGADANVVCPGIIKCPFSLCTYLL